MRARRNLFRGGRARGHRALGACAAALVGVLAGLALSHQRDAAHVLSWIDQHWLTAAAITAAATIAVAAVPIIISRREPTGTDGRAVSTDPRARAKMLRRMRNRINQILEQSLADAAHLALGLRHRQDIVQLGTQMIYRRGGPAEPLPGELSHLQLFDDADDGLLILGAPGSGKTTWLMQLAAQLLDRAERDNDKPIPVVFNLASWAAGQKPLDVWLAEELALRYRVPSRTARAWIEDPHALALLLDGLDEVSARHRVDCSRAINTYRGKHGWVPVVISCRTQDMEMLAVRPDLEDAVELLPPTDTQINDYLRHLESAGTPLEDVRAAIATDETLHDLLRSPLMLHVIALAYQGEPAVALKQPGSIEERQQRLWAAYIAKMLDQGRVGSSRYAYTPQEALSWLGWLAYALRDHDQTEFQLDRLTVDWVVRPSSDLTKFHTLCDVPLINHTSSRTADFLVRIVSHLDDWTFRGIAVAARPAEELHWSWPALKSRFNENRQIFTLTCLMIGPIAALTTRLSDKRSTPNEGFRLSAKNSLLCGAAGFLYGILFTAAIPWLYNVPSRGWLGAGAMLGIFSGLVAALAFGGTACILHYLVRATLTLRGAAPWRYQSFLDDMTEGLLLRRYGNGYQFPHRMLRDYFSDHHAADGYLLDYLMSQHLLPKTAPKDTHPNTATGS